MHHFESHPRVSAILSLTRKSAITNLLKVTSHYDSKSRHFGKDAEIQAMDGNFTNAQPSTAIESSMCILFFCTEVYFSADGY